MIFRTKPSQTAGVRQFHDKTTGRGKVGSLSAVSCSALRTTTGWIFNELQTFCSAGSCDVCHVIFLLLCGAPNGSDS